MFCAAIQREFFQAARIMQQKVRMKVLAWGWWHKKAELDI